MQNGQKQSKETIVFCYKVQFHSFSHNLTLYIAVRNEKKAKGSKTSWNSQFQLEHVCIDPVTTMERSHRNFT